jgi:hypothetical protein
MLTAGVITPSHECDPEDCREQRPDDAPFTALFPGIRIILTVPHDPLKKSSLQLYFHACLTTVQLIPAPSSGSSRLVVSPVGQHIPKNRVKPKSTVIGNSTVFFREHLVRFSEPKNDCRHF